jgi:hypothetical protein
MLTYAGRHETWHNTHAKLEDSMTKLHIVPDILDEFHITGMLKVWYRLTNIYIYIYIYITIISYSYILLIYD